MRLPRREGEVSAVQIAVVVGNPKPASRTLGVATALADALAAELGAAQPHLIVDLAEHAGDLFDWGAPRLAQLTDEVASAALIVAASPTYKATYTGMLKAFFDRYGPDGLAGSVAVPLMTGGSPVHALAVEVHLRPLLVELGAAVPTRGLYVTEPEFAGTGPVIGRWAEAAIPLLRRALS
jgi:FMN reductase